MFEIVQSMLYLWSLNHLLPKGCMCHGSFPPYSGHKQEETLPVSLKQGILSGSHIYGFCETSRTSLPSDLFSLSFKFLLCIAFHKDAPIQKDRKTQTVLYLMENCSR